MNLTESVVTLILDDGLTTTEQKAYTAGFLDGEGSIMIIRNKPRGTNHCPSYHLDVLISNTNKAILELISSWFPEYSFHLDSGSSNNGKHKVGYMLRIRGERALEFLLELKPFIQLKKVQLGLAIEFMTYSEFNNHRGKAGVPEEVMVVREDYWSRMKQLNRRGL